MPTAPPAALTRARRLALLMVGLQATLVVAGWVFRARLYGRLPVVPGEPAGVGDVIELAHAFTLAGTSLLALVLAVVVAALPRARSWPAVLGLSLAGLGALPLFLAGHAMLVRP